MMCKNGKRALRCVFGRCVTEVLPSQQQQAHIFHHNTKAMHAMDQLSTVVNPNTCITRTVVSVSAITDDDPNPDSDPTVYPLTFISNFNPEL